MAINRYDQPAQAQFTNNYVPIPFDEMMKIGVMKQARIDKGMDQEDALRQSIASMKVAPADEKAYNDKISQAYKLLDEGMQGGPGSVDHMNAVRKARNFLVEDPEMRMMSQNYPSYAAAATALKEAEAEYGANSPTYYRLAKQLKDFNEGDGELTGTQYLMQKDGRGFLQAEGIGTEEPIQPILDEYLKPVKADLLAGQGLDASGNFMIGSEKSEITPNKLGSVLGIQFKVEVEGGKKIVKVDRDNINYPRDIDSTPAGVAMRRKAEMWADRSEGAITKEEAFKQLYADAAVRSIASHTSSSSKMTMDADPFSLASYKKKLDDELPEFSSNVILASESSKFNSKAAVEDGLANFDLQIDSAKEQKDSFIKEKGIKEQVLPIAGENNVMYLGADGKDYSVEVREKQLEVEEYEGQRANLEKMLEQTKADLRIPKTYEGPSDELRRRAEEVGRDKKQAFLQSHADKFGAPANEENQRAADELEVYAKEQYIEKNDPYYKSLNKALKDNAAKNSFNAKVTRFGNVKLNTAAENHFKTAIQNNAFFNTDGSELSIEEKNRLSKLSFVSTEKGQENNVFFEGALWNKEKHMYQFAYSVNDSNVPTSGNRKTLRKSVAKTILVEAPDQAVDILIDKGLTTQAQQVIQQQASMLSEDPNKETKIYFGDPKTDEHAGVARKIRESEKQDFYGKEYVLEVMLKGKDGVDRITPVPFGNITELGIWYENYRRQAMKK